MTKQYFIIYKFTILAKLKMDDCRPFYIGQHITYSTPKEFLSRDYHYYGSGKIWNKFINKLKIENPSNWRYFIKREILFCGSNISQCGLDALEAYYIKKFNSHYSFKKGGCNVLWSASFAPSKDPEVRKKISESHKGDNNPIHKHIYTEEERKRMAERMRGKCYMSDNGKQRISEYMRNRVVSTETRNKIRASVLGENNPNWGKRGEETSMYGRHHTEEFKKRHSERMKGENNPMYGKPSPNKGKTMSEEQKQKISRALKGRVLQKTILKGKAHPMYGKKQSEETKLKRSNSLRGRKHSPETIEKLRQAALLREERKRLLK